MTSYKDEEVAVDHAHTKATAQAQFQLQKPLDSKLRELSKFEEHQNLEENTNTMRITRTQLGELLSAHYE